MLPIRNDHHCADQPLAAIDKGYPPGLRENGGQYSHAAMWAILAFAELGARDKAHNLFSLVNPINHALTPSATDRYKVEPYVVAADVYSVAPHVGRGGWTWYTGSAGWMQRAGVEGILGIGREGEELTINPCIPKDWPGFEARVRLGGSDYDIRVDQNAASKRARPRIALNGRNLPPGNNGVVRVKLDGLPHRLEIEI